MEKYHCLHHSSVFWMSKTDIHFWKVLLLTKIPLSTGMMRSGASHNVYAGHVVCKPTLSISIVSIFEHNSFERLTTFFKNHSAGSQHKLNWIFLFWTNFVRVVFLYVQFFQKWNLAIETVLKVVILQEGYPVPSIHQTRNGFLKTSRQREVEAASPNILALCKRNTKQIHPFGFNIEWLPYCMLGLVIWKIRSYIPWWIEQRPPHTVDHNHWDLNMVNRVWFMYSGCSVILSWFTWLSIIERYRSRLIYSIYDLN